MKLNKVHTGWAVNSIEKSVVSFATLGYKTLGSICEDKFRNVRLLLISNHQRDVIELVEPLSCDSPISGILKVNGPAPYHVCFSMNVEKGFDDYKKEFEKNGFIVLHKPSPAPLLQGKDVVFLYSQHIGLIELVLDRKEI